MKRLLVLIVLLLVIWQIWAGLVSASELAEWQKSGDVLVISARAQADYAKKHISGAINLPPDELYQPEGVEAMLKPVAEIADILGEKGITAERKIVIYDDGTNKATGRLFWILKYMGAQDVHILDGHIKSWMKERKPVTDQIAEIKPAVFKAEINQKIYASFIYVKEHLQDTDVLLLDVRSAREYQGEDEDEKLKRKGHIKGAHNFDYAQILNEDNTVKSKAEIAALLKAANITSDKEIILYCASSVRAGIVYLALTSLVDFPHVRVYDGALYEWSAETENPME